MPCISVPCTSLFELFHTLLLHLWNVGIKLNGPTMHYVLKNNYFFCAGGVCNNFEIHIQKKTKKCLLQIKCELLPQSIHSAFIALSFWQDHDMEFLEVKPLKTWLFFFTKMYFPFWRGRNGGWLESWYNGKKCWNPGINFTLKIWSFYSHQLDN